MLLDILSFLAPTLVLVVAQLAALGIGRAMFWAAGKSGIELNIKPLRNNLRQLWQWIVRYRTHPLLDVIAAVLVIIGILMFIPDKDYGVSSLAPEMIGMAFTIFVLDRLVNYSSDQREIKRVISRMGATDSNDVALAALAVARAERWLYDGSLHNAILTGAQLQDAELNKAELQGVRLGQANLIHAKLDEANLKDAYLSSARLKSARLRCANLQGANLQLANLQKAWLWHAKLQEAILIGAELQCAELQNAKLQNAYMMSAELQGAKLQNAQLQDACLMKAKLQGANLSHANLEGADLMDAKYDAQTIPPDGFDLDEAGCTLVNDDGESNECTDML